MLLRLIRIHQLRESSRCGRYLRFLVLLRMRNFIQAHTLMQCANGVSTPRPSIPPPIASLLRAKTAIFIVGTWSRTRCLKSLHLVLASVNDMFLPLLVPTGPCIPLTVEHSSPSAIKRGLMSHSLLVCQTLVV